MITEKDRIAGSGIVAMRLSQLLFTALVKQGIISEALAHSMVTELAHTVAREFSGDARNYAQHVLIEMRQWLERDERIA